ncbi:MAG: S46 family peptidase [Bacteroidales bacterium]|nr:S46 family peptidase [Bacteroidales bacterium]
MKKYFLLALILLVVFRPFTRADEGMWVPLFIESVYDDMKDMGLSLTPEEIYSINNSSLKDAIAIFGRGCTSELISDQGLLLTNHHCGYGRIQAHSSVDHDYLTDGFWAQSLEEELPNEGLSVTFLIRIEDVTGRILESLNEEMDETAREETIYEISEKIVEEAIGENHYNASVRRFYAGNEFYLFVYETYRDVRLVGAPPSSIGKFGADTDNWMWPRHNADFSIFRVYTDQDGKPADYSGDNIPMKPKHYLPVSVAGVEKGDFSMILGYPGSTDRYMTSHGIKMALDISNQTIVEIRDKKLKIMMDDMQADDAIRIKYASKYARTSNYWKYYIGQTKGLKKLDVYGKKADQEKKFNNWAAKDPEGRKKYNESLDIIEKAYATMSKYELANVYLNEAISRGSEIVNLGVGLSRIKKEFEKKEVNEQKIAGMKENLLERAKDHFKDYNAPTDQKLLAAMLEMYYENVPPDQQPPLLGQIVSKYKGDFNAYAGYVFEKSNLTSYEKLESFLEKVNAKKIDKDPAYQIAKAFYNYYYDNFYPKVEEAYNDLDIGYRYYIAGLREMYPDSNFYPDANFTMRLTYGTVLDYYPADAVYYNYYTTLNGVMEKEDPNNWEFVVPEKLKELYKDKNFGRYGEGDVLKVCFLTTHDITGGNSGSPVLNGNGELIGLAFDGNWEAMSGDIAFEPELQRTINVDIRYVLFIIDKYAGAQRLIDEMDIVNNRPKQMHKNEVVKEVEVNEQGEGE